MIYYRLMENPVLKIRALSIPHLHEKAPIKYSDCKSSMPFNTTVRLHQDLKHCLRRK